MSESVNLTPFICKWLDTHSKPQHFETWEKLRNHVDEHDLNSCNRSSLGDPIYICPWKDCNKHQSSIVELEEHLRRHTQQRPFKCPICNSSRFSSPDKLNQHLIIKHNDSVVSDDDTLYDENEELNLDKSDVYMKKEANKDEADIFIKGNVNKDEIIPINNTTKLSYRDVLIKGRANENKITREFLRNEHKNAVQDLLCKGMEAISLLPESQVEYDLENENYDDLPDAPQEELSEAEQDDLMWEAFREAYKDSKAVEYFSKAFEMMENGP